MLRLCALKGDGSHHLQHLLRSQLTPRPLALGKIRASVQISAGASASGTRLVPHVQAAPMTSQRHLQVAYLGPEGTYSHQVAAACFEDVAARAAPGDVLLRPYATIREAFESLFGDGQDSSSKEQDAQAGIAEASTIAGSSPSGRRNEPVQPPARYAVLPIENSTHGPVGETMRSLGLDIERDDVPLAVRPQRSVRGVRGPSIAGGGQAAGQAEDQDALQEPPPSPFRAEAQEHDLVISAPAASSTANGSAVASSVDTQESASASATTQTASEHPRTRRPVRIVSGTTLFVQHALLLAPEDARRLRAEYAQKIGAKDARTAAEEELPFEALAQVTEVASHEQALGQCKRFLSAHLPRAKVLPVASTALAASRLLEPSGESGRGVRAAIASAFAAQHLGLSVARHSIQDTEDNTTRFIVLTREEDHVFR